MCVFSEQLAAWTTMWACTHVPVCKGLCTQRSQHVGSWAMGAGGLQVPEENLTDRLAAAPSPGSLFSCLQKL